MDDLGVPPFQETPYDCIPENSEYDLCDLSHRNLPWRFRPAARNLTAEFMCNFVESVHVISYNSNLICNDNVMISFNDLVGMEVLTMTMVVAVMMTMIMTTMTYYIAIIITTIVMMTECQQ